jgi:hypothetical protein
MGMFDPAVFCAEGSLMMSDPDVPLCLGAWPPVRELPRLVWQKICLQQLEPRASPCPCGCWTQIDIVTKTPTG